jgi:UDP-3-O-[3-hydroxymyristoyl] glucosamine N-acyltransferase
MCASVLFVSLPLAQADVVEDVERVMNKDVFGQSVFASSYATLSANSTINGDVSSGAATTLGAGAIVHGSTLSGAATTLGAYVLVNGKC